MAQRTRGETLLNAYMNRYVNDQSSAVNRGQKNIQNAATVGSNAISAVPTDLPELTDFSSDIYSGLLENEETRQKMYEEAVKAAQEAAKKAAKAASYSGTKKSTKASGASSGKNAELSTYGTGKNEGGTSGTSGETAEEKSGSKTSKTRPSLEDIRANKDKALGVNRSVLPVREVKKTLDDKQSKEESARASTKKAEGNASNYAAGRSGVETSTDIGLASTSGAYAQARQSQTAKREQQEYASKKAKQEEQQKQKQAQKEAEEKTAYENLKSDFSYAQELAKPGTRLTDSQIKAVNQYLDEQPSFSEKYKQYQNGEISLDELQSWQNAVTDLKQKTSLGGLGQDLQAVTAGIIQGAVPFLEPVFSPIENALNDATGGVYNELNGGQGVVDALEDYGSQSTVGNIAGQFAGGMALYGLANSALEGTALASKAGRAGEKIASGLSKIPGVGNLVTEGTGQAIGNILIGQGTDVALDTIPSLAGDVYDYTTDNPDNLTPMDIAGRTAANFGVNAAMNVGSEALPALLSAGKNAVQKSVSSANEKIAQDVGNTIPELNAVFDSAPQTNQILDLAETKDSAIAAYRSAPVLTENDTFYPQWVQAQTAARQAELGLEIADTPESIARSIQNLDEATARLNEIYGQETVIRRLRESSVDATSPAAYNQENVLEVNHNENVGGSVSAGVQNVTDGGAGNELQPRGTGTGIYEPSGIQGTGAAKAGNAGNASANGTGSNASLRAQEITGKSRKSVYTRDIESVFEQLRNGASPDSLREEAARIAQGIVKESDFSQDIDEATSAIKSYLKNTQIRIDENAAADILYKSGLKNIQQYNIQNGTKLSLSSGVPYNAAMQELAEMNVGVTGDAVDDLMDAVQKSKTKALVDTDLASSYSDYVQERILSGADSISESFDDWLERQGFDYDSVPQYTRNVYDRWVSGGSLR